MALLANQLDILDGTAMAPRFPASLFAKQILTARYYCPELPRLPQPLEVVCAGWEDCRPDFELSRRAFPWWGVELIARGRGWVDLDGCRYPMRTGTVFAYSPKTALRITADPQHPFLKYFAIFTGPRARRMLAHGPLRLGHLCQALYPQEMQEILEHVITEGNRKSVGSAAIATDYLRIFFQKLDECTEGPTTAVGGGSLRALESFLRARAFLEENFARLGRADEAAHELGTRPETLCRLFRRFSQSSPYQFLLQLRINLAVDLLLGTDLLVKQVAEKAGFDDPFHFSRVFKRMQGLSPAAFQRMHKHVSGGE